MVWTKGLTDGSRVGLHRGVEVSQEGAHVCALGEHGTGEGQAAEGEDGEVGETHGVYCSLDIVLRSEGICERTTVCCEVERRL
jgi:hypothetical protein